MLERCNYCMMVVTSVPTLFAPAVDASRAIHHVIFYSLYKGHTMDIIADLDHNSATPGVGLVYHSFEGRL